MEALHAGQHGNVTTDAFPDRKYDGFIKEISPEANRQKGTLQVKVQIRNPDEFLTPELSAKVDFLAKETQVRNGTDSGATR